MGEATVLKEWGGDHGRYFGESPELTVHIVEYVLGPALGRTATRSTSRRAHRDDGSRRQGLPLRQDAPSTWRSTTSRARRWACPCTSCSAGSRGERDPDRAQPRDHGPRTMRYDEAEAAVAEGISTIKIKVGRDAELRRRGRARGPRRRRRRTSTSSSTRTRAGHAEERDHAILRRMEEYRIRYAEQPVEGLDADGAGGARRSTSRSWPTRAPGTPHDILEIARARRGRHRSRSTRPSPAGCRKAKKVGRRRRGRGAAAAT